jgi:DNA-binding response OmpR family regulator
MPGETVLVIDDSPTILKVVQLVLTKARYRVETAEDGEAGLELARTSKPALILLDFVMPRMNGYQFCREMASDPELKDIPIVLMSAKGDQVGERFVKVMGIVDYITKPFSPDAITAVVQHTITKYARRGPDPDRDDSDDSAQSATAGQDRAEADDEDTGDAAAQRAETARKAALDQARDQIAALLAGHAAAAPDEPGEAGDPDEPGDPAEAGDPDEPGEPDAESDSDPGASADAHGPGHRAMDQARRAMDLARRALGDDDLAGIITRAAPAVTAAVAAPALGGDLRVVPIAQVLQLLDAQEQSGVLVVQRDAARAEICFRKGRIDLAMARDLSEELLLGRFIVNGEYMSREDFDGFLDSRAPGSVLIGTQLVKLGYIQESDLAAALTRQTCAIIYEVLRWRSGSFQFRGTRELPFAATEAGLGLDVEMILMEGFRRVDEWHLIERELDDFDLVFLRNEDAVNQMGRSRLTREELAILELINGKNTIKDIIRRSRLGSFEVSRMLYRLQSIKLIRRRVMPVAV